MFSKWQWMSAQLTRTLWGQGSLFALLAILTALIATSIPQWFGKNLTDVRIEAVSVGSIISCSMLAVTIFSLNTLFTAYGSASSGATSRATQRVQQDITTQNVLSTFIGAFLFSLVGITALRSDVYDESG